MTLQRREFLKVVGGTSLRYRRRRARDRTQHIGSELKASEENAPQMVSQLFDDSGIITATVSGLRMSPHVYNTTQHVDRLVAAVRKSRRLLIEA